MNTTNMLVVGALIILVGAGGWFFFSGQNNVADEAMMEKEGDAMTQKNEGAIMSSDAETMDGKKDGGAMIGKPDGATLTAGSYEAYAPEKLAKAQSGDVVLFFRASWCPTCRALNADIQANASAIPAGVAILDVDYDNSIALKQKYGVTVQHTLVQVDANGNLIKKWIGSPTLASLIGGII